MARVIDVRDTYEHSEYHDVPLSLGSSDREYQVPFGENAYYGAAIDSVTMAATHVFDPKTGRIEVLVAGRIVMARQLWDVDEYFQLVPAPETFTFKLGWKTDPSIRFDRRRDVDLRLRLCIGPQHHDQKITLGIRGRTTRDAI